MLTQTALIRTKRKILRVNTFIEPVLTCRMDAVFAADFECETAASRKSQTEEAVWRTGQVCVKDRRHAVGERVKISPHKIVVGYLQPILLVHAALETEFSSCRLGHTFYRQGRQQSFRSQHGTVAADGDEQILTKSNIVKVFRGERSILLGLLSVRLKQR